MILIVNGERLEAMTSEVRDKLLDYYNTKNSAEVTLESLKSSGGELKIPFRYTEVDPETSEYHKKMFTENVETGKIYDWDYAVFNCTDKHKICRGCATERILNTFIINELGIPNNGEAVKAYVTALKPSLGMIEGLYEGILGAKTWKNNPHITLEEYTSLSGYVPYVVKS